MQRSTFALSKPDDRANVSLYFRNVSKIYVAILPTLDCVISVVSIRLLSDTKHFKGTDRAGLDSAAARGPALLGLRFC